MCCCSKKKLSELGSKGFAGTEIFDNGLVLTDINFERKELDVSLARSISFYYSSDNLIGGWRAFSIALRVSSLSSWGDFLTVPAARD